MTGTQPCRSCSGRDLLVLVVGVRVALRTVKELDGCRDDLHAATFRSVLRFPTRRLKPRRDGDETTLAQILCAVLSFESPYGHVKEVCCGDFLIVGLAH